VTNRPIFVDFHFDVMCPYAVVGAHIAERARTGRVADGWEARRSISSGPSSAPEPSRTYRDRRLIVFNRRVGAVDEPAAEPAEQSLHDVILELLDQDVALGTAVKDAVLNALAEVVDQGGRQRRNPDRTNLSHRHLGSGLSGQRPPSPSGPVPGARFDGRQRT
jgi:hypothetical protein